MAACLLARATGGSLRPIGGKGGKPLVSSYGPAYSAASGAIA